MHAAAERAITEPLEETPVRFDAEVVRRDRRAGRRPPVLPSEACLLRVRCGEQWARLAGRVCRSRSNAPSLRSARRSSPRGGRRCPQSSARSWPLSPRRTPPTIRRDRGGGGASWCPAATRQALRRLAATATSTGCDGMRGRYAVSDRLFRRYLSCRRVTGERSRRTAVRPRRSASIDCSLGLVPYPSPGDGSRSPRGPVIPSAGGATA